MPKNAPTTGTIKSMGLQAYLDAYYYNAGGWPKFVEMQKANATDQAVADQFRRKRPTCREWRLTYEHMQTEATDAK